MECAESRRIIQYDRAFLFHMKSQPICLIKPEWLPNSMIVKGTEKNRLTIFKNRPGVPRNIVDGFVFTPGYVKSSKPQEDPALPGTSATPSQLAAVADSNTSSEELSYSNGGNVTHCSELEKQSPQMSSNRLNGSSDRINSLQKFQIGNVHSQVTDATKFVVRHGEMSYNLPLIISGVPVMVSVPMDKQTILLNDIIKFDLLQSSETLFKSISSIPKTDTDDVISSQPTEVECNHNAHSVPILLEESTLKEQVDAGPPHVTNESTPHDSDIDVISILSSEEENKNISEYVLEECAREEQTDSELFVSEVAVSIQHNIENSDNNLPSEALYKKVKEILIQNHKQPQKFPTLVERVNNLGINSVKKLKGVTELVFQKGINEPSAGAVCASFCKCLASLRVPTESNPNDCVSFKKMLLKKCHLETRRHTEVEQAQNQLVKDIAAAKTKETKKELKKTYKALGQKAKQRFLGSIRFIQELFTRSLITEFIVHFYLKTLLAQRDEDSLKYMCQLLTVVGKALDVEKPKSGTSPKENKMDGYFNQMHLIVNERRTTSKVLVMLQEVLDLRLHKWIPPKERKSRSITQQNVQVAVQKSKETKLQEQQPTASHPHLDYYEKQRKANNTAYESSLEQARARASALGVKISGCNSKVDLSKESNVELPEFTEDDELCKTAEQASNPEFNPADQSASECCRSKHSLKESIEHQESSLNEGIFQEQVSYYSHLKPTRDRLELFGEYVADLMRDVAVNERRKCQSDVLKVINGYADRCTVKVELT